LASLSIAVAMGCSVEVGTDPLIYSLFLNSFTNRIVIPAP
jgi:hypothetical protein